jgi:hypothetical protein
LCESLFNDPVEGIQQPVNVGRLGVLIDYNDQGVIDGVRIGGGNHRAALPALDESAAGFCWRFVTSLPARS